MSTVQESLQAPETTKVEGYVKPQHFIDGEFIDGAGSEVVPVFDPATGQQVAEFTQVTADEVDAAVEAAAAAFEAWSELSIARRVQVVFDMRDNLMRNADAIARTLTLDQGKTFEEAKGEVLRAAQYIETALAAPMLAHSKSSNISGDIDGRNVRNPIGVTVAITPLNFPVMNPSMFISWALVTGNTVIIKPSEQDPMATTALFKAFQVAGLPKGVINLVHGNADAVRRLIAHEKVVAVSCITSTPVAKAIYEQASALGKRVQANGGAKNPIVVADDADLDLAAAGIVSSAFGMAGQRCLAGTRIVAFEGIYDELIEKVAKLSDELVVGAGRDEGTTMGPVISAASRDRLFQVIGEAEAAGGVLVRDGRKVEPQGATATQDGYFVGPTIITDLDAANQVSCQETFGPLIVIHRVASLAEAITLANDTEFGNAASIFTRSGSTARQFEKHSRSGNIGVNTFPAPAPNFVMGGQGASFYGLSHVGGDEPLRFYTEEKFVITRW